MFSFDDIQKAVAGGAQKLIALSAGSASAISALEASNPLVATGIKLAEAEFPAIGAAIQVEQAVLSLAQDIVAQHQAAAAALPKVAN